MSTLRLEAQTFTNRTEQDRRDEKEEGKTHVQDGPERLLEVQEIVEPGRARAGVWVWVCRCVVFKFMCGVFCVCV